MKATLYPPIRSRLAPIARILSILLLAVLLELTGSMSIAHALPTQVTNTNDSGAGSLRQTINDVPAGGIIEFALPGSAPWTISLTSGLVLSINKNLTITGPGRDLLIIDAGGTSGVFEIPSARTVSISNLTIQKGKTGVAGGAGISSVSGIVTLTNVLLQINETEGMGAGMKASSGAQTSLNNVTFKSNTGLGSISDSSGAGFFNGSTSTVTMNNVTFDNNTNNMGSGAGFDNESTAVLHNVVFTSNHATDTSGSGGGIFNNGTLTIDNSSFSDNGAVEGAALENTGTLTATNVTFSNNTATDVGGAIFNYGTATITNAYFVGNAATTSYGGVIDNNLSGVMTLTNATLYNNSSGGWGSAIVNAGSATLRVVNSTIAGNTGTLAIYTSGAMTLKNTIVANNPAGNCETSITGTITDGGGNLRWPASDTSCPGTTTAGNPALATPANNGGSVYTSKLQSGSAAINAGNATTCAAAVGGSTYGAGGLDARGQSRRSGACDSGAYEAQPASLTAVGGTTQSALVRAAFANPLQVNVKDDQTNNLAGVVVTYTAPASGASANLSAGTATTNASGNASVTAVANGIPGGPYTVTAAVTGVTSVSFSLINLPWWLYLPLVVR